MKSLNQRNCDIHLDRNLAELRIFPAIDIQRSGTRKEELLIPKNELESIWSIRRYWHSMIEPQLQRKLIDTILNTESNKSFLEFYEKGRRGLKSKIKVFIILAVVFILNRVCQSF